MALSTLIVTLRAPDYTGEVRPDVLAGNLRISREESVAVDRINRDHLRKNRELLADVLADVPADQVTEVVVSVSLVIRNLTDAQKQRIVDAVHGRNIGIAGNDFELELIE